MFHEMPEAHGGAVLRGAAMCCNATFPVVLRASLEEGITKALQAVSGCSEQTTTTEITDKLTPPSSRSTPGHLQFTNSISFTYIQKFKTLSAYS